MERSKILHKKNPLHEERIFKNQKL